MVQNGTSCFLLFCVCEKKDKKYLDQSPAWRDYFVKTWAVSKNFSGQKSLLLKMRKKEYQNMIKYAV